MFQSTHPARGATDMRGRMAKHDWSGRVHIQSTHPRAGCDSVAIGALSTDRFASSDMCFNPRTPREGCDAPNARPELRLRITKAPGPFCVSIHAPRAGCATRVAGSLICGRRLNVFNPRHPRAGCDVLAQEARTADREVVSPIHAPRAGCDHQLIKVENWISNTRTGVSIHAPRAGCDTLSSAALRHMSPSLRFQSTHPARGATVGMPVIPVHASRVSVSIHAPARGVRTCAKRVKAAVVGQPFQSTQPAWAATINRQSSLSTGDHRPPVSIHAPRAGCGTCQRVP